MQEVDFNYVISHLEKEIKSLEESISNDHDKDAALCRTLATLVLNDKRESLSLIKQAVRTERDRMRTANDLSDALAYALSTLPDRRDWFTDDFYKALNHAKGNMPSPLSKPSVDKLETDVKRKGEECRNMARMLDNLIVQMKSHISTTSQERLRYIQREETLKQAAYLLRECEKILVRYKA